MRAVLATTVAVLAVAAPAGAVSIPTSVSFSLASQTEQTQKHYSHDNIANDPATPALNGFINEAPGDQKSDYSEWASIGPWLRWGPQEELEAAIRSTG